MILKGKVIDFLGDSITEGVGVENCEKNRYDNIIKQRGDLKAVYNYGIGGTRFAHQSVPSENPRFDLCFCGRVYNLSQEADIIVVYGGVNDYIHGDAPIGNPNDKTPATFYGAVEFLMTYLKNNYTDKLIVFMTPAHMCYSDILECKPSPRPMKREDALCLKEYVEIIIAKGKEHNLPVLNLYETLGIDPNIEEERIRYTSDGLHFNDAGHAVLADCLMRFLEKL